MSDPIWHVLIEFTEDGTDAPPIVDASGEEHQVFDIVDGHQRLTTCCWSTDQTPDGAARRRETGEGRSGGDMGGGAARATGAEEDDAGTHSAPHRGTRGRSRRDT